MHFDGLNEEDRVPHETKASEPPKHECKCIHGVEQCCVHDLPIKPMSHAVQKSSPKDSPAKAQPSSPKQQP